MQRPNEILWYYTSRHSETNLSVTASKSLTQMKETEKLLRLERMEREIEKTKKFIDH